MLPQRGYLKSASHKSCSVVATEKMTSASARAKEEKAEAKIGETLIGMERISEILETSLYSAHITQSIPISVFLIGPSGAGKSKLIMQYHCANGCHLTSDVTSMGLQELLASDHENKIRCIIIPDFNLVLSHRASTLQLTIANLLSVMSEGTIRVDDGRQHKETKHSPCGVITAMTRDLYVSVARKWNVLGLNRRFLPIYYEYSLETRQKIQERIMNGTVTLRQLAAKELTLPAKDYSDVSIGNLGVRIQTLSDELATNMGWIPASARKKRELHPDEQGEGKKAYFAGKALEFSPHLALRSMARAHALRDGRNEINESDTDFLIRLIGFTRFDRPGQI